MILLESSIAMRCRSGGRRRRVAFDQGAESFSREAEFPRPYTEHGVGRLHIRPALEIVHTEVDEGSHELFARVRAAHLYDPLSATHPHEEENAPFSVFGCERAVLGYFDYLLDNIAGCFPFGVFFGDFEYFRHGFTLPTMSGTPDPDFRLIFAFKSIALICLFVK